MSFKRDADALEDFLQEFGLILATTITKCQSRSREAAKKCHADVTTQDADTMAALLKPQDTLPQAKPFSGCGGAYHRGELKKEIDQVLQQGIITPVTEPTEWCAPIVIAPQKDTDCIRLCVNLFG